MKTKRILALVLSLLMLVSLLPVTALAADPIEMVCERAHFYSDEESYSVQLSDDDISKGMKFSFDTSDKSFEVGKTYTLGEMDQSNTFMSDYSGNWYRFSNCDYKESADQYGNITIEANATLQSGDVYHITYVGYAITNGTTQDENGSISVDNLHAAENETVTVTVTPNKGYQIKTLKYNDGEDHEITADDKGAYKFTMPAKAVTVTAEFEEKPTYTYEVSFPEGPEQVYIIGDTSNWASFVPMTMTSETTATITVDTQFTGYKYTAGDAWKYVERDAQGSDISNRTTYADPDVVESWADVPPQYRYTEYENWQIKYGNTWEWTENLEKVEDGLYKMEILWEGTGINVKSDENPIKKDWYAPEELTIGEELFAPATVDVYLRVIDNETLKIGIGEIPSVWPKDAPAVAPATPTVDGASIIGAALTTNYAFEALDWPGTQPKQLTFATGETIYYLDKMIWQIYTSWDEDSYDMSEYGTLHIDLFPATGTEIKVVFEGLSVDDGGQGYKNGVVKTLTAGQWNGLDIALSEFPALSSGDAYDFSDIRYLILEGYNAEQTALSVGNVYFYGTSTPTYDITDGTAKTGANGSIEISKTTAAENDTVTVTTKPNEDYELDTLTVVPTTGGAAIATERDSQDENKYTFKMPAYPVTVTATFTEKSKLYWGFNEDAKSFYLSATEDAITGKGATANKFNPATVFGAYYDIPWYDCASKVEQVEILNDIAPDVTALWFYSMKNITEITGIEHLDTSNVTSMKRMFDNCQKLASLDLSKFDTSKVTTMEQMFSGCKALTTLDLSKFNTANVTNMSSMFDSCEALETLNLGSFNTSKVTDMSSMFDGCEVLTALDLSKFNTEQVTKMSNMFDDCKTLETLNLSNFNTLNVTNMGSMFDGCEALETLNIGSFNTQNVTNMGSMFSYCKALETLDLSNFNTQNVTNMASMFNGCEALKTLNLSSFNTSKVETAYTMFGSCYELKTLDLSSFDMSNATTASGMFAVSGITKIKTPKNLTVDVELPSVESPIVWNNLDTLEVYQNANLPKNLTESLTLVASLPIAMFDIGNGEKIVGEEGKLPEENPTWDGYTFSGWYKDKDFTQKLIAEDVKAGETYFTKWINNKSKKTILIQPITIKADGLYLGDTPADNTALSQYGIKFTPAENDNPAILELDGATIMAPGKYTGLTFSEGTVKIYSLISNRTGSMEIAVKSESNIISTGVDVDGTEDINLFNIYVNNGNLTFSGETLNIVTDGRNESQFTAGVYNSKEDADNIISNKINVTVKNTARGRGISVAYGNMTICGKAVVNSNVSGSGALYGIYVTKNLLIKDDAIVTTDAKSTAANAYGIAAKQGEITDNAVVTAKADGGNENANGIQIFGNEGEGLVIGGNAVVNAYGGNGTKKVYAVDSVKTVIIKDNAKLYAYGGLNSASGEKDAMYIESKNYLYLRDNAQLIADGSLPFGEERSIIFEGEPCNAFLSAMGDVKAYVTGMVTSVNGNGELEDDAGFTQKYKNAPIVFTGKQCKVDLDGILTGYGYFCGLITKPEDPVKDGYVFAGWFADKACTKVWNFDTDAVFEDMTLYPKWIKDDTAVEANNMKLAGSADDTAYAVIDVYSEGTKIKSVATDVNGNYDLGYLTQGDYTLKITANGRTVTELLHIEKDYTPANISLVGKTGTDVEIVESGSDTPHTMVGGLSKLAQSYNDDKRSDLSFKVEAQTAESVSVSAKDAINAEVSGGKKVAFVDMSIFREYIGGTDNGKREPIHNSDTVLEIVMNYDTVKRQNIEVIRYHDGVAQVFEKLETRPIDAFVDGTYYVGDGFIVIYADKFSEYAIGYTQKSSGGGSGSGGGSTTTDTSSSVKTSANVKNGSVSVSPKSPKKGETVTVNTTPDKGYEIDTLTVKDSKGNVIDVTDAGNGKYTFIMPDSTVSIDVTFNKIDSESQTTDKENELAFSDVKESDWFYNQVKYVYDNKLMQGISDSEFAPNMPVTRAMFVTVLYRLEGEPAFMNDNVFADVEKGSYYEKAVVWAQGNGIVKGISETEYAPNTNITREQMAAIIYRYANFKGIDTESVMENTNTLSHNDIFKVSDWAKEAMNYCIAAGIITGDNNGNLNPQNNATRAEFATILMRVADIIK